MNAQHELDLVFNVLLACSRLWDGGERRQSRYEKKRDLMELRWSASSARLPRFFFVHFPNFAMPHMISDLVLNRNN